MRRALAVFVALALAAPAGAQTVDQVVAANGTSCTTRGVEGLSNQLVDSHLCEFPGTVSEFTPHPRITLNGSRVHPLAASASVAAIRRAADTTALTVNSAFRTLVEQYLLYEGGGCGLAAVPGRSNHQSGLAVDLQNWSAARSAMLAAGCTHPYPGSDDVHFDCPGPDMRPASVLVFQKLWNLNNPGDRIDEDGAWGPQTRARLGRSPSGGFPEDLCGASGSGAWGAQYVAQSFPLASQPPPELRPGEEYAGTIELRNIGSSAWDSSTRLATTVPRDHASMIAGSDWLSDDRPAQVSGSVPNGSTFTFAFSLRAPSEPGDYCENLGVVQEGVAWFSDPGQLGPPDDQLEVCIRVLDAPPIETDAGVTPVADAGPPIPGADAGPPVPGVDAGPMGDDRPGGAEGCSCRAAGARTSSTPLGLLALIALAALRRRGQRRRATTTCDSL